MKDTQNTTIAVLIVTAALLITALLLTGGDRQAVAAQAESRGENYSLAVVRATASQDLLYLIDVQTEQMNAYTVDKNTKNNDIIMVAGPIDLRRLTRAAETSRNPSGR